MPKKAIVKCKSLRTNLVNLPFSLCGKLRAQQTRPQGLILHFTPIVSPSSSTSRPTKPAYLGWSGHNATSSLPSIDGRELETVEVDPEVALGLGWADGTIVEIAIIYNPIRAKSVSVTPLTSDDWEILEQHARFLEDNLLSQLRAAQKGQIIDAWVSGGSKIRIRVDDTNPITSHTSAVLVNPDTEIYVAPKPRLKPGQAPAKTVAASTELINGAGSNGTAKAKDKAVRLRLVPRRVAATWGWPKMDTRGTGGDAEVWANEGTISRVRTKLGLGDAQPVSVRLRRRQTKGEKVSTSSTPDGARNSVDDAKDADGSASNDTTIPAWLMPWDPMPDGCMVIQGRKDMEDKWAYIDVLAGLNKKKPRHVKGDDASDTAPAVSLARPRLAGMDNLRDDALIHFRLQDPQSHSQPLLVTGAKGSGKTSLVNLIAAQLEEDPDVLAEPLYIDVGRVDAEGRVDKIKQEMAGWFEDARQKAPCLLILDGLDMLVAPENELSSSPNPGILAEHFCRLTRDLQPGVLLLVTAISSSSLHPLLNIKHVFGSSIKVPAATKNVREEIIRLAVEGGEKKSIDVASPKEAAAPAEQSGLDFVTLASMTEGYSPADLLDLVANAKQQAIMRRVRSGEESTLGLQDFTDAQAAFTPLSLRGVSLQKSDVKWSDIGGLAETRRVLRETLEWPTKYAQIFANCPLRLRSGLLLFGYPGCGKTLLASAVAKECGLNFISVKGPEILNKYIGASEKSVRDLFERATAAKPCVLFFDEFDSIAPRRGHDSTGVTDRVVNQMLTEMDGAQGLEGVYVLAATSRPDLIDPALLRPGRLDKSLLCGMPDQAERLDILRALAHKLELADSVDLEAISFDTDGFSGADLQAMMYNAHLEVIHAQIDASTTAAKVRETSGSEAAPTKGKGKGKANGDVPHREVERSVGYTSIPEEAGSRAERSAFEARIAAIVKNSSAQTDTVAEGSKVKDLPKPIIEQYHLQRSLANTRPSVPPKERIKLENIYKAFMSDRDGSMSSAEDGGRDTGSRVSLM